MQAPLASPRTLLLILPCPAPQRAPSRYGERSPGPQQQVWVERKVHRDRRATGELSFKERAPLEQAHVQAYTRERPPVPVQCVGATTANRRRALPLLAGPAASAHTALPLLSSPMLPAGGTGGPPGMADGESRKAEFLRDAQRFLAQGPQVRCRRLLRRCVWCSPRD